MVAFVKSALNYILYQIQTVQGHFYADSGEPAPPTTPPIQAPALDQSERRRQK
jgi:hypothetical protein